MSDLTEPSVLLSREGGVAILTLNEPERRNPLSVAVIEGLAAALEAMAEDDTCRSVVITGAGRGFCSGGDLSRMAESSVWDDRVEFDAILDLNERIWSFPKPTVAAVHGFALGGGANLVAWCDYAVVEEGTRLGFPEIKVGLPSASVIPTLLRTLGRKGTLEVTLTGDDIDLHRAVELGLVSKVVPAHGALKEALEIARVFDERDPIAVRLTKEIVHSVSDMGYREGLSHAKDVRVIARMVKNERAGIS